MIILAIGMGLFLSLQFLLEELTVQRKRERKAAETIRIRFQARQRQRSFLGWWRNRRDPTSIMGRSTAWDTDQSMVQGHSIYTGDVTTTQTTIVESSSKVTFTLQYKKLASRGSSSVDCRNPDYTGRPSTDFDR